MRKINKRGLSPVITTVLLIAIVIVAAVIIFLWASQFIPESIEKDGRPIERVCEEVSFQASYDSDTGEILLSNTGNVPIYAFSIEEIMGSQGRTKVTEMRSENYISGEEEILGSGGSGKIRVTLELGTSEIIIKPVLLGKSGEVEEKYLCDNHPGVGIGV